MKKNQSCILLGNKNLVKRIKAYIGRIQRLDIHKTIVLTQWVSLYRIFEKIQSEKKVLN